MSPLVAELLKAGVIAIAEIVKAAIERRKAKADTSQGDKRSASDILEEHGELEASAAKERAHAARKRARGRP